MKAEDLMIGDWVAFRGHPYRYTVNDLATMAECEKNGVSTDTSEIPLTQEILDKNFKEFIPGLNCMYELGGPYMVSLEEHGQWVFGLAKQGKESARYPLVKISFVHELQHALRLCGIEKEVIL